MKLKKFKSFKVERVSELNWMYHLAYVDFDDITVSFSKEGYESKDEAQNFGHTKRIESNSLIPFRTSPENGF